MDPENTPDGNADPDTGDAKPPETTPPAVDYAAEAEKWKGLARKHERESKARAKELDETRQASLSDAEKAIEDARAEGRKTALTDVGSKLANAELRAEAAKAGVELPDLEFVNLARFLGEDGEVNSEAVAAFVGSLSKSPPKNSAPEYDQDLGLGRQRQAGPVMDPAKLAAMVNEVSPY